MAKESKHHEQKAADSQASRYAEDATAFFSQLQAAVALVPDYMAVYSRYADVLLRFLDQRTAASRLNFSGPFAKMDYLLKESQAPAHIAQAANAARVRIRNRHNTPAEELEAYAMHDLKALCQLIAFIDKADIPAQLSGMFPPDSSYRPAPKLLRDYMRMIVDSWDDDYIYGTIDGYSDGTPDRVLYSHGNQYYDYDWSYLRPLLSRGTQLNLLRPRLSDDGSILPELIILEPDYLVDVTAVAHCFTHYADSPLVGLIRKLQPQSDSQAIELGNFAGQLLDEELHRQPEAAQPPTAYRDSVMTFFRNNALNMLTTYIDPDFHNDARSQQKHISDALNVLLPRAVKRFDRKEGIVEPSFVSEMLGLQGRMDFLQLDYKVLMEQKSGKGRFPYNGFVKPTETDEHYVQLLLYMLLIRYNHRDRYEANHELHAFLLYSKYSESLLAVGMSPEKIFQAIKIRNGIAWSELRLAQPDAFRILDRLTPDSLNQKQVSDKLWRNYQQPQLAAVLDPIHQASELERAYFFRFLTFISNEHVLSKLGNKTKENSGFASTWQNSADEKRHAGNIYDGLTLVSPDRNTQGRITTVKLRFADDADNDLSNFRQGDIVILYPYDRGQEPDARRAMLIRCSIEDITGDNHIVLRLRAPQSDARIFTFQEGKCWAIEHDFMEASFGALYRGMLAFLLAPKERRDLILLQRRPRTDQLRQLRGDYGQFDELSLRVKRARDLFIIIGPPGTGKTSYGMLNTLREELLEPDTSVLLTAYTNRAVDEICSKLHASAIDFVRIGGELTCSDDYKEYLISSRVEQADNIAALKQQLSQARVYVGTTSSITSHLNLFELKQFSLAIIDEASQILEPQLMGILSATHDGLPAISKFVMIGDHKQLPAVVQQTQDVSRVSGNPLLEGIGLTDCRQSLFERLLRRYHDDPDVVYCLTRQGRMHPLISEFTNHMFYGGRLKPVPLPHQQAELPSSCEEGDPLTAMLLTHRFAFIDVPQPTEAPSDKVNPAEAGIIAEIVKRIYRMEQPHFDPDETVGVIVPYRNQIAAVRKMLDRTGIAPLHDITIDTVERFQGSQRRWIVYGFTIQKFYQLNFLTDNVFTDVDGTMVDRKLNVAMTRAEEHLIIIGNTALLRHDPIFSKLISYARSKDSLFGYSSLCHFSSTPLLS